MRLSADALAETNQNGAGEDVDVDVGSDDADDAEHDDEDDEETTRFDRQSAVFVFHSSMPLQ